MRAKHIEGFQQIMAGAFALCGESYRIIAEWEQKMRKK